MLRKRLHRRLGALLLASTLAASCSTGPPSSVYSALDRVSLEATIEELYTAFCFDPGSEPDWQTQRRIYLEGATFVAALRRGGTPRGGDTEEFLSDFRSFATSVEYAESGFHERIVDTRIGIFGGLAHAFVLFEGFYPGDGETLTRGIDSLQLVHDGESWRLVSFTTQYETEDLALPERL